MAPTISKDPNQTKDAKMKYMYFVLIFKLDVICDHNQASWVSFIEILQVFDSVIHDLLFALLIH